MTLEIRRLIEKTCHKTKCYGVILKQNKRFTEEESIQQRDGLWIDYFVQNSFRFFIPAQLPAELDSHKGRIRSSKNTISLWWWWWGKSQVLVVDHVWSIRKWQTMPYALSALVYISPCKVVAQALCITLYKSVEISCHSFWWSCILRTMICEVMILVFRNDFRSCPRVRSGVNFWKTLKTAGCAGVGGL